MPIPKLKIFVGIDGKWVLCEKFKDTEENAGLDEMLEELIDQGDYIDVPAGLYLASFGIEQDLGGYDGPGDAYLCIDKTKRIRRFL